MRIAVILSLLLAGCTPKTQSRVVPSETIAISGFVRTEDGQPLEGVQIFATTTDWDHDGDCDLRDWSFSQNHEPLNWRFFFPHMKGPGIPWVTPTEK